MHHTIITFVGLCVLTTTEITTPVRISAPATARMAARRIAIEAPTTLVVLPRVGGPGQTDTPHTEMARMTHNVVEKHVTIVALETRFLIRNDGWATKTIGRFTYVELNGDVITFDADPSNPRTTVPANLAHLGGTLRDNYRPPYRDAAAVFQIPVGTLRACASPVGAGRIDSELTLDNPGDLIIRSGKKTLTVNGDAMIYAGNIPYWWLSDHLSDTRKPVLRADDRARHSPAHHYTVYCEMVGKEGADCQVPAAPVCIPCAGAQMKTITPCNVPQPQYLMSSECSNTQWP